jgi:hypothetical protein
MQTVLGFGFAFFIVAPFGVEPFGVAPFGVYLLRVDSFEIGPPSKIPAISTELFN